MSDPQNVALLIAVMGNVAQWARAAAREKALDQKGDMFIKTLREVTEANNLHHAATTQSMTEIARELGKQSERIG